MGKLLALPLLNFVQFTHQGLPESFLNLMIIDVQMNGWMDEEMNNTPQKLQWSCILWIMLSPNIRDSDHKQDPRKRSGLSSGYETRTLALDVVQ